jgi:hypothetical protein
MSDHALSPDQVPAFLRPFSQSLNDAPLRHLGTRYDLEGTFLPEPGNTVVCHLVEGSATQAALTEARQAVMALPEAGERLAFTPLSSLHMTLFQGIIEYRRDWPFWPKDMPADASIDTMTAHYLQRLEGFAPGPAFRVRASAVTPNGVTCVPLEARDEAALRTWRDALAEAFGYRHPDHDDYVFHITFAYLRRRLSDAAILAWRDALPEILAGLQAKAPVLQLRAPAFCSFADMKHFEELRVLPLRG